MDVTKLTVAFQNSTNASENLSMSFLCITDYAGHGETCFIMVLI
jgi:hypothetical protein